ncbi:hypothetical protein LBW59_16740 [Ralstonia solanacearum]|uniref:Transmembrane protein n=1 Tax=Ralstonia solanacearum TaxID=305 RepID=A0AAW5ZPG6_RALSL|nr:hypothetical protein [Ralstonia solanacearum]MDB0572410.1 hypothetical protein [Ralstonia solanacearum]
MESTNKKPLSHAQMALAITAALAIGALPLYLAVWKANPWPCIGLIVASQAFLMIRRRQRSK